MFTRTSNFTYGNYRISNIETDTANNNIELMIHIQKYEEQCLRMILGDCLYLDLMANVERDTDGIYQLKDAVADKWGWLLNGKSYPATSNGCGCGCSSTSCDTHSWDGLVKKIATIQTKEIYETVMASYIFYHWSLNYRTLALGTGEGKGNSNGSTQESSKNKRADAWNELVQSVSFGYPNGRVSLNKFLEEHQSDFPEAQTTCLNTLTYYDI